jgi:hypothetical protein
MAYLYRSAVIGGVGNGTFGKAFDNLNEYFAR